MKSRYKRIVINRETVLEHRYIMEQHIGRKLRNDELVHHKNGNKFDNRVENLEIVTQEKHDIYHKWKYPKSKLCVVCGKRYEPCESKRKTSKVCSFECKIALDKINAQKRKRAVIQYTLSGEKVKQWASARDIQNELGFCESNINKCCKGKSSKAYGYFWTYAEKGDSRM